MDRATKRSLKIDPDVLKKKYAEERAKRLRPDGERQYRFADEVEFESYTDDPYLPAPPARDSITADVEVLIVGAGFAGILSGIRLKQAGIDDFTIIDGAGDFGGTWYWNRYPGCACDVESYIYMPLLEEVGYVPTEKYAKASEILEHSRRLGQHFSLYDHACFSTRVISAKWNEPPQRWIVETDRGDTFRARFLCVGSGPLNRPKLPGVQGITEFEGHSFHTSRWDYDYTGGSPTDTNLTNLADKRVGIIGTGATAIQCIPHLGKAAKQLYVFQRTPSAVGVRGNKPTDPAWKDGLEPGWQARRAENFDKLILGIAQDEDLVDDGWTHMWSKLMKMSSVDGTRVEIEKVRQLADYEKMEEIRARVDSIVKDPATAESLKPYYNMFCKRPTFHDEYLETFNRSNVTLVDTDGKGIDRVTGSSVIVGDRSYDLDCLIYATGFDTLAPVFRAGGFDPVGRGGVSFGQKWSTEMASLHGIFTHGLPNFFMVAQFKQAAVTINFPTMINAQAQHIAAIIRFCKDRGITAFDVTKEAELNWAKTIREKSVASTTFAYECTPGYYNNEGSEKGETIWGLIYGDGPFAFIDLLCDWRANEIEHDMDLIYQSEVESGVI